MPVMAKKDKRFELRLTVLELRALEVLAERKGVTKSHLIAGYLHREAAKKGIPI